MKHYPPRWIGWLTLVFGLYVIIYQSLVWGSFLHWIFPTGIITIIMMIFGLRWSFSPR
jgi:hypothetical protein